MLRKSPHGEGKSQEFRERAGVVRVLPRIYQVPGTGGTRRENIKQWFFRGRHGVEVGCVKKHYHLM